MARAENGFAQQVPFPVNDYATGMLGALGVVFAVLRRDLTGVGSRARGSLVRSGTFLQLISFEPHLDPPKRLSEAQVLRCNDGYVSAWLPVAATGAQRDALAKAAALAADASCEAVIAQLWASGVSAMREQRPKEMLRQPWVAASGLAVEWTSPVYGRILQSTPRASASAFEPRIEAPAPAPAADSRAVLQEIGLGDSTEAFIASGAVIARLPMFAEGD
jgi:crotonobetainyl-CoA:carnitine CoA-transferase CaiB-like acyl-CoA transferase